jgi:hypothetical protein
MEASSQAEPLSQEGFAAFQEMIGSPEYQAIAHLRTEALAKGELHPMEPGGELP